MNLTGEQLLRIEYIPLDRVKRWDKNPKRHDLPRLIASIKRYGFRDAVIFDGTLGALVAGHGRALALEAIRNEDGSPPAGIATDAAGAWYLPVQFGNDAPSRAVAEAFALDHNNLTLAGTGLDSSLLWDAAGYADVLRTLSEGFELPVTVGADEVGRLLGLNQEPAETPAQIDRADELRQEWGVESGQVWELGRHRLICGDCTDKATVERVMGGEKADFIFTDPPYGVSYGDKNRHLSGYDKSRRILTDIEGDQAKGGIKEIAEKIWRPAFANMYDAARPGCAYYMTMPQGGDQMMMMMMMMSEKWLVKHELIWVKNQMVFGRADYHYKHEPIMYGWKPGGAHYFIDDRTQVSVWEIPRPIASQDHPTTKPVKLVERAMTNSSKPGDICADFFLGSGTTLIACENLNRQCRAVEIDPGYVAVTLQRFCDLTHQEPRRV